MLIKKIQHLMLLILFSIQILRIWIENKNNNIKLAQWIVNQRASYQNGQLSTSRVAKLEELGIDRDPCNLSSQKRAKTSSVLPHHSVDSMKSKEVKEAVPLPQKRSVSIPDLIHHAEVEQQAAPTGAKNVEHHNICFTNLTLNRRTDWSQVYKPIRNDRLVYIRYTKVTIYSVILEIRHILYSSGLFRCHIKELQAIRSFSFGSSPMDSTNIVHFDI